MIQLKQKRSWGGLARSEKDSIAGILKTALPSWLIGPNSHSGAGKSGNECDQKTLHGLLKELIKMFLTK